MFSQVKKKLKMKKLTFFIVIFAILFFLNIYVGIGQFKAKGEWISEHKMYKKLESNSKHIAKIRFAKVRSSRLESFDSNFLVEIEDLDGHIFHSNLYQNEIASIIKRFPSERMFHFELIAFLLDYLTPISSLIFLFYILEQKKILSGNLGQIKVAASEKSSFTFDDVAGIEEEKEEMTELIDFLKNPSKYKKSGAVLPKGVLLQGPPGTGKTLLAKAVAGEAGVPFFAVSGAEFDGMLVGLGVAKIKKLFKEIKNNTPCVLFIDEIDVLGKKRGSENSKSDQTLNQLLVEMDGFNKTLGVIIMAATNRADILDPALLRPGRFDRQFNVGLPDLKARKAILAVHAQNKKLDISVDLEKIAKSTPGMNGAQLAAILNEAAILSVRNNKTIITEEDLYESIDRVMMGPAKKSKKYDEEERTMVAYHEAGHAVIGLKLKHAPQVQKITIIPRGDAGGYNLMLPEKETFFSSKKRMLANITSYLGGRAAEELMFDDVSSGAYGDFKQATQIARLMVTKYGMSELGPTQDQEFSDKKLIDQAIKQIIDESFALARQLLQENKKLLDKIAQELLKKETINKDEIKTLLGEK